VPRARGAPRTETDIRDGIGKRGGAGRLAPKEFARRNEFG